MRHDPSIPSAFHADTQASVKDALGSFWSSVFGDQPFVDALLAAPVLSAAQLHVDAMEALSLRDHSHAPVYHREHWHPLFIRRSERNTARGLTIGMPNTPIIGGQTSSDADYLPGHAVYHAGEVFEVGGNAEYSKVNVYPLVAAEDVSLVSVKTCICDAIHAPTHLLLPGRDFAVEDGVFVVRKEQDPFDVDGYRMLADGDDRVAVLWACDALFDTENVGDFLAYPLGFDVPTTETSAKLLSALWDVVTHGVTPRYLNAVIGAAFGVDVIPEDAQVESVTDDAVTGISRVVTDGDVYDVETARLRSAVVPGVTLRAGDFITDDVRVYHGLSKDDVSTLASGDLSRLVLKPGSVAGVAVPVVLENRESPMQAGGWFQLSQADSGDSPFWSAVRAKTTAEELSALFTAFSGGAQTVNPVKTIGYLALANAVVVFARRGLVDDPCARSVMDHLSYLVPDGASLHVVIRQGIDDIEPEAVSSVTSNLVTAVPPGSSSFSDTAAEVDDNVTFTFVPVAATEV